MRRFLRHRFAAVLPAAGVAIVLGMAAGGGHAAAESDPWAKTYTAAQYADRLQTLDGRYDGVGLRLRLDDNRLIVADVEPGTSADRAGVRVGEQVVSLGARDVDADDFHIVVDELRSSNVPVHAVVAGEDGTREVTLATSSIESAVVQTHQTADGDQVVRVDSVVRGAADKVASALTALPQGAGVVLDLRGNGGGLVTEAVRIAGVFLDGGDGVSYQRMDGTQRAVAVPQDRAAVDRPLVVLVDSRTASAAEIVAGILQDRGRALVIGERTFGKGTVQEPIARANGTIEERTVGHYALPSGRLLDGVGLKPDVHVPAIDEDTTAFVVASTVLNGLAPHAREGR